MKRKKKILVLSLIFGCALTGCSRASASPRTQGEPTLAVIIDTDPGTDDSTALMMAQANMGSWVKLVVSTYGNGTIDVTTENAAKLADLYGMSAEVLMGADKPMTGVPPLSATEWGDGIVSAGLTVSARKITRGDTSDHLYKVLKAYPGADYVVLGPMTNLANLLEKYPDSEKLIGRVVTMAGGLKEFNVSGCAEFNIYSDPIAAEKVFASGLSICLIPLDTTNQVVLTHEEVLAISDGETERAGYLTEILLENERANLDVGLPGAVIYDASALAYMIKPELFSTRVTGITVSDGDNYGQTVETKERQNVTLVEKPDRDGVYELIVRSGHSIFSDQK